MLIKFQLLFYLKKILIGRITIRDYVLAQIRLDYSCKKSN